MKHNGTKTEKDRAFEKYMESTDPLGKVTKVGESVRLR